MWHETARSLTGPLILILIGVLFLTRNLWQEVPMFELIAQYWPFILIAWGVLRLIEVLIEAARSKPLPSGGLSGGEVALIILLCIVGSGMYAAEPARRAFRAIREHESRDVRRAVRLPRLRREAREGRGARGVREPARQRARHRRRRAGDQGRRAQDDPRVQQKDADQADRRRRSKS